MDAHFQSPLETILVVDDQPPNRQLLEAQLGIAGYTVNSASSGEEALLLFGRSTPDLILLDIMMPGLSGFETFHRLRELPGGAEIPIVFLTAAADPAMHKMALEQGADDFLCKPISRTELLIRVRSLLRVRRLHTELRRRSELLRTQRDALLRVQKQKDELMAFVVHDLNNPLTNIVLLSDQLVEQTASGSSLHDSLREIAQAAGTVSLMVMNLLDISRSEDGALVLQLSRIDLPALLRSVCQRQKMRARQRAQSIDLSIEEGVHRLRADIDLLTRIVNNLLDNALKYAPLGTTVRVDARLTADQKNIELRICDEGLGIPLEHRERIFDKYAQLDNAALGPMRVGRGLGLTFCRLAAEAHGGHISIEDNKPRGSVFCLHLPLNLENSLSGEY